MNHRRRFHTWMEAAEALEEGDDEMGEEAATRIEEYSAAAELEDEEEEEADDGPRPTGCFSSIEYNFFQANLSNLFSSRSKDQTSLSPMHFTHAAPPAGAASTPATLQVFSVEVQGIKGPFRWPLHVYGVVAARDAVDRGRNVLFLRKRDRCQILTQKDPCLRLTGPSRAIVATDPVDFEIKLKVVNGPSSRKSQDRVLMRQTFVYSDDGSETATMLLNDDCCKIALRCAKVEKTVQATVVSVRVVNWRKRAWPFKHGGKVSCVAKGTSSQEEVVLQDQLAEPDASCDGYLHLSRHAVSVELDGELRVVIHSPKFRGHVFFPAQECKSSRRVCHLGPYEVEVTVAWSLLIRDKRCISRVVECVDDAHTAAEEIIHRRRRKIARFETTRSAKEIYSLLDFISGNAMKLKAEPRLRITEFSASEVRLHMDDMYEEVTSLLRAMERVHKGTYYYKCGLNAIFNELDQLCTRLDQMGHLTYNRTTLKSQSLSGLSNTTGIKPEPPMETVEAPKGKEMGGEAQDSDDDKSQTEEEYFAGYRQGWVSNWSIPCGTFTETTSLSPMHFTPSTPGHAPFAAFVDSTLQVYSIKVARIEDGSGLSWPLQVYGVVAARDEVDRNRNILFLRKRNNCQMLTQEDPFLRLTGPSRAIVTREPANVEIQLMVKGGTKSEDSPLMSDPWYFNSISYLGLRSLHTPIEGHRCTMVLSAEELYGSVQATIVGIRVVGVPEGRPSPFEYGGRVACSSLPRRRGRLPDPQHIADDPSFRQVVLQDGAMTTCSKGYINLSRHVVSVKLRGKLEVVIDARSPSGAMASQVVVSVKAQKCDITENICKLGDSELEITVAWSRLVREKGYL
ncbi:unnamed protein product [Alopecurus aequalis]